MPASSTEPRPAPFVMHQGPQLAVVNKPAGMPVQPDPTADPDLLSWARKALGSPELELVNRLDRPVCGLVVLASGAALSALNNAFRERRVRKLYRAVVEGVVGPEDQVQLEHAIVHNTRSHKARTVTEPSAGGRTVRLRVRVLGRAERYTLVEIEPDGGAFHQIRAQLSGWGHPIKGDVKYGARRGEKDRSIALQAASITLPGVPDGPSITVDVPLPEQGPWRLFRSA
jgi:23S rRNA pseudouridine1911/1915/1917 synthase